MNLFFDVFRLGLGLVEKDVAQERVGLGTALQRRANIFGTVKQPYLERSGWDEARVFVDWAWRSKDVTYTIPRLPPV